MATQPLEDTTTPPGRPVLGGAYAACAALAAASPERVWSLTEDEVADAVRVLGALSAGVDAQLVTVLAEAKRRSLGAGEGWGPVDWARAHAPGLGVRKLAELDVVAEVAARDELRLAEVLQAVSDAGDPLSARASGALPVGKAAQLVRFHKGVRGLADADDLEGATAIVLESARGHDGLSEKDLGTLLRHTGTLLRPDRLTEHDADVKRAHRSLVKSEGPCGMSRYTMLLDDEGVAIVDAAIDALAKPQPVTDPLTGAKERDPRSPATRRADALVDLVRRAVGAPDGMPRQAKTSLLVTIGLDVLQGARRGAGLTMTGDVLTTETVRRLACDAELIPAVLGGKGEVLEQGRAERLFTRGQIRHLWMRDRHCTFPGCSRPASWDDAHHLIHWADGGPTDIWNAALLCQAHHTVVHREKYAGRVVDGPGGPHVVWDLVPGTYDTAVAAWKAAGQPALRRVGSAADGTAKRGPGDPVAASTAESPRGDDPQAGEGADPPRR